MTRAQQTNAAMLAAAAASDATFANLTCARAQGAGAHIIAALESAYAASGDLVNQLWDDWNDAMQVERLARIYR